jgi:hypothetical protein
MQTAQTFRDSFRIDCPKLVNRHEPATILKAASDTPWVCLTASGHWCNDECAQMSIEFIG